MASTLEYSLARFVTGVSVDAKVGPSAITAFWYNSPSVPLSRHSSN
jgi:hypothetical protein